MAGKREIEIRSQAQQLLEQVGVRSLPVSIEKVAKHCKAQVRYSPLDPELSGMVYIKEGLRIIGVNSLHHPNRQRFTIAHEIGHLELHEELLVNEVHVDKQFKILMRDTISASGKDRIEVEANQFASELLMPMFLLKGLIKGLPFDIDDDKPVEELARKCRVSRQALEYQMRNWT